MSFITYFMQPRSHNTFPTISLGILLLSIVVMLFLSSNSVVLSLSLIALALIKHVLSPIKKELLWYVLTFFGAGLVEIALVNFTGSWSYASAHFLNVPVWAPLFWSNIAITMIELYEWIKG